MKVGREPTPVGIGAPLENNRRTRGLTRGNPQQNAQDGLDLFCERLEYSVGRIFIEFNAYFRPQVVGQIV